MTLMMPYIQAGCFTLGRQINYFREAMKKVLITLYKNKCHSLYREFIYDPPEGYQYFTLDDFTDEFIFEESGSIFVEVYNKIRRNRIIIDIAKKNNIDIIYCTSGMLLFNSPIPWVIEFESAASFIIHKLQYWRIVKRALPFILRQKNLKALIPWTEAAARSLLSNIAEDEAIKNKITPIHLCLRKIDDVTQKNRHDLFTLLFVTTLNNNAEKEFYTKGGRIIAEIFNKLKGVAPMRFILRSKIPEEYQYLKLEKNIEVYEDCLPYDKFKSIFLESDVFFFPCYQSPGLVFLDAMNGNLPIISTNIFSNPEMVIEGYNGFLIDLPKSSKINFLETEYGIKNVQTGKGIRDDDIPESLIEKFCEKIMLLYKDATLKEKMGNNSKNLLINEFSIHKRNEGLKAVYDKIFG